MIEKTVKVIFSSNAFELAHVGNSLYELTEKRQKASNAVTLIIAGVDELEEIKELVDAAIKELI